MASSSSSLKRAPKKRLLQWIGIPLLCAAAILIAAAVVVAHRAAPVLKSRITETLRASFHGRVELQNVEVVSWHGFEVTGDNLRIFRPDATGADPPLISLKHFSFHAPWFGVLLKPTHVGLVRIAGLGIDIPPGVVHPPSPAPGQKSRDKIQIVVDQIVCEDSRLVVENANPEKGPKDFALEHIELHNVGPQAPWSYQAKLMNAIPRGEIKATGNFGPWQIDNPGDSPVSGHYTFEHADLHTINGIGGNLSSLGDFQGKLDRIAIDGTTETPDFSLDTANHPVPLQTRFHAIVDSVTGDTYLDPVQAVLRDSHFKASGTIVNIRGQGHVIDLDVDVPAGRLQDFLDLTVRTEPAVLTATIGAKARLHIDPGKQRVAQKLRIHGHFTLRGMHFTNPQVQDKVDMLSMRARGEPEKAKPGAADVNTAMTGDFSMQRGAIELPRLVYSLPGARVDLEGIYSLDGQVFDFRGHVLTSVPLYKMVDSRWASLALRAVSPFFRGKGGGSDIPVKISGTRSAPKFGLDLK